MRKFIMFLTLAMATLAASGVASAYDPPDCYGYVCNLVR